MEVLVEPTYSMDVSASSPVCARDRSSGVTTAQDKVVSPPCLFLKEENGGVAGDLQTPDKFGSRYGSDDSSDSSLSSIGAPDDSEDEDENDVVSSSKGKDLQMNNFSLDSLEDSLPIKRGLSNHYAGRSKSFANLSDVSKVQDLGKPDNPFNKRRRVLIASKWSRKSSFYSWQNPKSMPVLVTLDELDDEENQEHKAQNLFPRTDQKQKQEEEEVKTPARLQGRKPKIAFKSQSCFSLADLQEVEEQ